MKNDATRDERLKLPWDLTEWSEPGQLRQWVEQEIDTLDWHNPALVEHLRLHPELRPRMMLTLLTLAYATGMCDSHDVLRACCQEELFRSVCAGKPPAVSDLARFRRDNRGLLKWCLAQTFKRVIRSRFNLGERLLPAGLRRFLLDAAVSRIDLARHMERAAQGA